MLWVQMSNIRDFEMLEYKPVFIGKMTQNQFV